MRSPATRSSACSASKRRTSTERIRVAPGSNTPLSMPEMWAMGAGIRTASSAPSPCTCAMSEAFQLSPRCVCSTALGTPVEPEVKRTRATSEGRVALGAGRHRRPAQRLVERRGIREGLGPQLHHEPGLDLGQRLLHVGRAERVQHGRGHRPQPPAGPGEHGGGQAVGHLPGHGLAPSHAPGAQAARHRGHQRVDLDRREPGRAVDHLATTTTTATAPDREQRVERGHLPRPAGTAVVAGPPRHPRGSEAGRHGHGPYPAAPLT